MKIAVCCLPLKSPLAQGMSSCFAVAALMPAAILEEENQGVFVIQWGSPLVIFARVPLLDVVKIAL